MSKIIATTALALIFFSLSTPSYSAVMRYTFSGVADFDVWDLLDPNTVNSLTEYDGADFNITFVADPANRVTVGDNTFLYVQPELITIDITDYLLTTESQFYMQASPAALIGVTNLIFGQVGHQHPIAFDTLGDYDFTTELEIIDYVSFSNQGYLDMIDEYDWVTMYSADPLSFTATAVPIPAAVWLFGSGLGLLGWFRRRQTA